MKLFTFSLLTIALLFTLGCSTENPLCTDNYCIEGEIYPRSELVGEFSELAIDDSVILATLVTGTTPVETTPAEPADSVSFDAIVADAAADGTAYIEKNIKVNATVETGTAENEGLGLITNSNVSS